MALTVIAGLVSNAAIAYTVPLILLLAILKFLGVTFRFMEMSKANIFWKAFIITYLAIVFGIILIVL